MTAGAATEPDARARQLLEAHASLDGAYGLAGEVYGGSRRRDGAPYLAHGVEVALILHGAGERDPDVLAAALLHDAIEADRDCEQRIRGELGERVAELVLGISDDPDLDHSVRQKEELRHRVRLGAPAVAAIYAADKLSNVRVFRAAWAKRGAAVTDTLGMSIRERLALWQLDAAMVRGRHPGLGFLDELDGELTAAQREILEPEGRGGDERPGREAGAGAGESEGTPAASARAVSSGGAPAT